MHCATLDIKAKVEYTLVLFMLSFCCLAGFWSYLPSSSRSNMLLPIFLCVYISLPAPCVLRASEALAIYSFPGYFFDLIGVDGGRYEYRDRGRTGH
jgi:hypothetical protein